MFLFEDNIRVDGPLYHLPESGVIKAKKVAEEICANARKLMLRGYRYENVFLGLCAEYAFGYHVKQAAGGGTVIFHTKQRQLDTINKTPDLTFEFLGGTEDLDFRLEVKATRRLDGDLLVPYRSSKVDGGSDWHFVLCYVEQQGNDILYRPLAWIPRQLVFDRKYWCENMPDPCWVIPKKNLFCVDQLINEFLVPVLKGKEPFGDSV